MILARGLHLSDCALHDGKSCDCGELKLTDDARHRVIALHVSLAGRVGFFIDYRGRNCFIEAESAPGAWIAALATASNLPNAGNLVAFLRDANGVDFDHAKETVIGELKALTLLKGGTCSGGVQLSLPISVSPTATLAQR